MTDYKSQDLPDGETTTLDDTDIVVVTKDPTGTPIDNWITGTNLKASVKTYPLILASYTTLNDPADATTYYFAHISNLGWSTTPAETKAYIPIAGTIKSAIINIFVRGTLGTTELSTLYVRLNNTTDTQLSAAINLSGNYYQSVTGLSIPVVVGDYIECKLVTPTWATNPTDVFIGVTFTIQG